MQLQQKEALITLIAGIVFILLKAFIVFDLKGFNNEFTLVLLALFIVTLWAGRIIIGARFRSLDERDKAIRYQAAMIATHGFGIVVVLYAFALYLLHRETLIVPVHQVLSLAYFSWISLYVFWSASMLVLHKTGTINV
jgi:hypothetical protein